MKRILLTLTMVLALGATGISAQSLEDAEGLQSSYGRIYSDGSSNSSAESVSASSGTAGTPKPMEAEIDYKIIGVIGLTFDSDEAAENFLGEMRTDIEATIEESDDAEDAEIKDLDIDNDGFMAVMNVENTGVNTVVLFVDGNQVFMVDVTHPDRDTANTIAADTAAFVADAESETDEVTLNEDGTSTGGVFDRMPQSGDDVVGGLEVSEDVDLLAS